MLRASTLRSSSSGTSSLVRAWSSTTPSTTCLLPSRRIQCQGQKSQERHATTHAISNPTLAGIEKRWELMPPQEQADLWMQLRDRMKNNWHELTIPEKKAAYWIAFGPHGPRALPPPGESYTIFAYILIGMGASAALFWVTRHFAGPAPSTMNKEWQEATNELLKAQNAEPISGISSENYQGKGQVQSAPKRN